jgi:hypothetical protein
MIKNDFPILTNGKAEYYGFDLQQLVLNFTLKIQR